MKVDNLGKKDKRPNLSFEEKMELFRRFLADPNTEGEIKTNTMYEGFPIGVFLVQIRSSVNNQLNNKKFKGIHFTQEQIELFINEGFLGQRRDSVAEKVSRIAAFYNEYPELWDRTKKVGATIEMCQKIVDDSEVENKEVVLERLIGVEKDYQYIYSRFVRGKLNQEIINQLEEIGIGRVFGDVYEYPNILEKFQDSPDINILKTQFKREKENGLSLGEFKEKYIQSLIDGERIVSKSEDAFYVTTFDLTKPDMVVRSSDQFYKRVYEIILNRRHEEKTFNFLSPDAKSVLDSAMESLPERRREALKMRYGFYDGRLSTYDEIGERFGVSRGTIEVQEKKVIINFLRNRDIRTELLACDIPVEDREMFFREFFKYKDIFMVDSDEPITEEAKSKLEEARIRLLGIIESRKNRIIFSQQFKTRFNPLTKKQQIEFYHRVFGESVVINGEEINVEDIDIFSYSPINDRVIAMLLELEKKDKPFDRYIQEVSEGRLPLYTPIHSDEIGLSHRAYSTLARNGIYNIEDILTKTTDEIAEIRNLGSKTHREIVDRLHELGFHFADEVIEESLQESQSESENTSQEELTVIEPADIEIKTLPLSVRSSNALIRGGLNTLGDMIGKSTTEIEEIRNLGRKSAKEIFEYVHSLNLYFTDENPEVIKQEAKGDKETGQDTEVPTENSEDSKLYSLLGKMREVYSEVKKEKQENQIAIETLKIELARVLSEIETSKVTIERLREFIQKNRAIFEESGMLEQFEKRLKYEEEKAKQKEAEEQKIRSDLQRKEKQGKDIDDTLRTIEFDG